MMSAFAIAGFQASTGQKFYSLVVDNVVFSNSNSIMTFNMDYSYSSTGLNYQTTWTKIKLSYVVVSTQFVTTGNGIAGSNQKTLGNYIFATMVGINLGADLPYTGIFSGASTFLKSADHTTTPECGYMANQNRVDVTCFNQA